MGRNGVSQATQCNSEAWRPRPESLCNMHLNDGTEGMGIYKPEDVSGKPDNPTYGRGPMLPRMAADVAQLY